MKITKEIDKVIDVPCITIPVDIYDFTVNVFTPNQNKELVDKAGWGNKPLGTARDYLENNGYVMVRLRKDTPDIVAHEMLHAVQFIMDRIGHNYAVSGDEPSAYLLDYLIREYYSRKKLLNNKNNKNNKNNTKENTKKG